LARIIHDTNPKIVECLNELKPLLQLKSVSFKFFDEAIQELSKDLSMVSVEVEASKTYHESKLYQPKDALFIAKLTEFHKEVTSKVNFIRKEQTALYTQVDKVMKFFGEPEDSKLTPEELFEYLSKFLNNFEEAVKDHAKSVALPKVLLSNKKKSVTIKQVKKDVIPEKRHMDNLLENLKNRPALQSFDQMQKPKVRDSTVEKRFPRAQKHDAAPRISSLTKVTDQTWKMLDSIEMGKYDLKDFSFGN
jgi:hypothetical protein